MVLVLSPSLAGRQAVSASERLLSPPADAEPVETAEPVTWSECEGEELDQGIRLRISHPKVSRTACLTADKWRGVGTRVCGADRSVLVSAERPPGDLAR